MHHGYMYGQDDPLCWPQLFCPKYPHLACIQTKATGTLESDPFDALFAPVTMMLFVAGDKASMVLHIGRLCNTQFFKLKVACLAIITTSKHIEHPPSLTHKIALQSDVLVTFLKHLKSLLMNFEHICSTVWETQRVAHLLCAMVEYMLIYNPRIDRQVDVSIVCQVSNPYLVGAFIWDTTTLQWFCQAGIPVWCFHPLKEAH